MLGRVRGESIGRYHLKETEMVLVQPGRVSPRDGRHFPENCGFLEQENPGGQVKGEGAISAVNHVPGTDPSLAGAQGRNRECCEPASSAR